jgi:hypothetical protein
MPTACSSPGGDEALNVAGVGDLRAVHIDGFASALDRAGWARSTGT